MRRSARRSPRSSWELGGWRPSPSSASTATRPDSGRLRAADRALPLLQPGLSLRFAVLPAGEDPDTLIAHYAAAAMREALDQARPLAEIIWPVERNRTRSTRPSGARRWNGAWSEAGLIADPRNVADKYRRFFRERLFGFARDRPGRRGSPHAARLGAAVPRSAPAPRRPMSHRRFRHRRVGATARSSSAFSSRIRR